MDRLRGKVAVVTGSSSGNGRAISLALAREGAALICSDIRKSALEGGYEADLKVDTDDLIREEGGQAEYLQADTRRAEEVQALVDRAVAAHGRLDVMVNNAGVFTDLHTIVDETEEQYDFTMDVNVKGVWLGCKAAITQMLKQDVEGGSRGKVINIASIGGLVGLASEPAYCTSKAPWSISPGSLPWTSRPSASMSTPFAQDSCRQRWCGHFWRIPSSISCCTRSRHGRT